MAHKVGDQICLTAFIEAKYPDEDEYLVSIETPTGQDLILVSASEVEYREDHR